MPQPTHDSYLPLVASPFILLEQSLAGYDAWGWLDSWTLAFSFFLIILARSVQASAFALTGPTLNFLSLECFYIYFWCIVNAKLWPGTYQSPLPGMMWISRPQTTVPGLSASSLTAYLFADPFLFIQIKLQKIYSYPILVSGFTSFSKQKKRGGEGGKPVRW